jgi:flavin reductase (DIM6/NTAB) family NADH-FMN oxidoreductase RutF
MHNAKPHGVTINSFASVSLNPPMVLFCLDKGASVYESFAESGIFTINILAEKQSELSKLYSSPVAVDWKGISYDIGENNCPVLNESIAYLECSTENILDGGDHSIFLLKVNNLKQLSNDKPLLYFKGEYSKLI